MGQRHHLLRGVTAALLLTACAASAAAQTGRVGGVVKDDTGQPIKGATVTAENPNSSPNSFTATSDDKGRFSIIGMRTGQWTFTAQAPGFNPERGQLRVQTLGQPNPPLTFTLRKGGPGPVSALGNVSTKEVQADLAAAEADFNAGRFDEAITKYRAILAKAPALSVVNLQIAAAYRNKKDYDSAIAAYNEMLKSDPSNDKATIGIGMTNMEKGDLTAAEATLQKAADGASPTREVFYNLGEVKFAKGQAEEAAQAYQKAVDADGTWGKPLFKLGLVALNKGDKAETIKIMEKVVAVDPTSQEAAQAKAVIEQLKK